MSARIHLRTWVLGLVLAGILAPSLPASADVRGVPRNWREVRDQRKSREEREARSEERERRAKREGRGEGRESAIDPRTASSRARDLSPGEYRVTRDGAGRTVAIEGWLDIRPGEAPSTEGERGMHRGHLIARRFGGRGDASNVVSMDPRINTSYVKSFENSLARRLEAGEQIYLRARVEHGEFNRAKALHYDVYTGEGGPPRYQGTYTLDPRRRLPVSWTDAVGKDARSWWYDFKGVQRPTREN